VTSPVLHVKDYARTTLRPRHRAVVAAMAEAYFSEGSPLDPRLLTEFTEEVDRAISTASKTLRFGLKLMLDAVRFAPLFMIGSLRPFGELALGERTKVLVRMERSRFAPWTIIFIAWKTLMTMIYFERLEVLSDIGYPGPERSRYRQGSASAGAARAERQGATRGAA
jgi:hypothetical protein